VFRTLRSGWIAAAVTAALLIPAPAQAAEADKLPTPTNGLVEVTGFGPNPTGLQMFLYVPASVEKHPAVIVALHYCTGSGPAMFTASRFDELADQLGYIVVYPSAPREGHCFDVSSPGALRHDGNSDPVGIVSMVRHTLRSQHADKHRVFVTGISSGAMMTNVLLGDYPDVFAAGSAWMGVPFACFATTDGSMWNSACANGTIIRTPQQWGDLVRTAFPGYRGKRPPMQLWHGTNDTILFYPNFGEEIKQWTDVHGASQTPVRTDHPQPTWTHTVYTDRHGRVAVDAYSVAGETHNLPFTQSGLAELTVAFFGL